MSLHNLNPKNSVWIHAIATDNLLLRVDVKFRRSGERDEPERDTTDVAKTLVLRFVCEASRRGIKQGG